MQGNKSILDLGIRAKTFIHKPIFRDYRFLLGLWLFIALLSAISQLHHFNNYHIFEGVFWHTINQLPLYAEYPSEYFDVNHYGPLFSIIIAPFALLPSWLGMILWCVCLTLFLFWAIRNSNFNDYQQVFILWFCAHEMITALQMQQFNIAICAMLLLTFYYVEKEKDVWAALCIIVGTLVKLYGIVGLAFFFFSKHKGKFILWLIVWGILLFALPMLMSSPDFVVTQYREWFLCLTEKNGENLASIGQNISLLGMVQRIGGIQGADLPIIIGGIVLFCIPYLRFRQYGSEFFRQTFLASVLMFVVLFSTGSESSGYITPLVGVVIWYTAAPWKRTKWDIALLVFVFLLSSMSPSDLFPAYIRRTFVQPYALKALPVFIVWIKLCYEMTFKDYNC